MFEEFKNKMLAKGVSNLAIKIFEKNFNKMINGESFVYESNEIEPLSKPDKELIEKEFDKNLTYERSKKVVVIKLNGGLGTSMGLKGPKSQLKVKNNLNFLEITVNQIRKFNEKNKTNVPLLFMNSFSTSLETEENLKKLNFSNDKLPNSFNENKSPKIKRIDENNQNPNYIPAQYKDDETLEWAPPGHADVYPSLLESGMLNEFKNQGYEYVFISNVDNLGACLTPSIINTIFEMNSSFVMEVAQRTENDKKGGHLALKDGKLILRESSQVLKKDEEDFQNYHKYQFFNTNSIWIKIEKLLEILDKNNGILDLPIIINQKNINPSDENSEKIIQLESAMGSAITLFDDAKTLLVKYNRFIPVKNTSNLLYLLSDLVELDEDFLLHPKKQILIDLKNNNYKLVENFYKRFIFIPSLINCNSLIIENDLYFNEPLVLQGDVKL